MKRQMEKRIKVLVVDVGGSHVKCVATGHKQPATFDSNSKLTSDSMVKQVLQITKGWRFDVDRLSGRGPARRRSDHSHAGNDRRIAGLVHRPGDRTALWRHAEMIARDAREGLPEEEDRRDAADGYQAASWAPGEPDVHNHAGLDPPGAA